MFAPRLCCRALGRAGGSRKQQRCGCAQEAAQGEDQTCCTSHNGAPDDTAAVLFTSPVSCLLMPQLSGSGMLLVT